MNESGSRREKKRLLKHNSKVWCELPRERERESGNESNKIANASRNQVNKRAVLLLMLYTNIIYK